jgi:hypothetical protein
MLMVWDLFEVFIGQLREILCVRPLGWASWGIMGSEGGKLR